MTGDRWRVVLATTAVVVLLAITASGPRGLAAASGAVTQVATAAGRCIVEAVWSPPTLTTTAAIWSPTTAQTLCGLPQTWIITLKIILNRPQPRLRGLPSVFGTITRPPQT